MVEFPLTDLAPALTNMRDQFLIADPHEVIFFSSDARFRFRTLSPLNEETRARLNTERVYGSLPLDELPIRERRDFAHGQLITLPRSSELGQNWIRGAQALIITCLRERLMIPDGSSPC